MSASLRRKERSLLKIDLFRQFMRKCMLQKIMTVMSERAFSDAFLKKKRAKLHYRIRLASTAFNSLYKHSLRLSTCRKLQELRQV